MYGAFCHIITKYDSFFAPIYMTTIFFSPNYSNHWISQIWTSQRSQGYDVKLYSILLSPVVEYVYNFIMNLFNIDKLGNSVHVYLKIYTIKTYLYYMYVYTRSSCLKMTFSFMIIF